MVAHQAVGVTAPPEALHHPGQGGQERLAVLIDAKDSLACMAARGDVIEAPGNSMRSGQARGGVDHTYVIFQDVTPFTPQAKIWKAERVEGTRIA